MRIPLICAVLVLAAAGCDRRNDPDAVPDNMPAPSDRTVTTPESASDPYPASANPSMPPAQDTRPTGTQPLEGDPAMPATPCAANDPDCVDTVPDPAREATTTPPAVPPSQ